MTKATRVDCVYPGGMRVTQACQYRLAKPAQPAAGLMPTCLPPAPAQLTGGEVERGIAVAVLHVAVGAGGQQHLHHLGVTACGSEQGKQAGEWRSTLGWQVGPACCRPPAPHRRGAMPSMHSSVACHQSTVRCHAAHAQQCPYHCAQAPPAAAPEAALCSADEPFWLCASMSQPAATSSRTTPACPLSAAASEEEGQCSCLSLLGAHGIAPF